MNKDLHRTINEAHFVHMVLAAVGYYLDSEDFPSLEKRVELLRRIADDQEEAIKKFEEENL